MTIRKQSALLLILICIFAACSGRNENLLVETEIPKEAGERRDPNRARQLNIPSRRVEYPHL